MEKKSELVTIKDRVLFLIDRVPAVKTNYKMLLILYWQVFDGIEMPKETARAILDRGAQPESIDRMKRKNVEFLLSSQGLADQVQEFLEAIQE